MNMYTLYNFVYIYMYHIQIPPKQPTWSRNGSCFPMSSIRGAIKMHIPASAFARCGTEKPPANILLSHVNAWPLDVSFENMKYYLPLILAMFDISPEGTNISKNNKYTSCDCMLPVLSCHIHLSFTHPDL